MWIELRRMIQEAFQRRLNATAPTAGHQGYALVLPFQQNAFGALAANDLNDDSAETVATQMAALTYQSQLTATTATNLSQQMGQYLQTLAHQQDQLHQNQHQMMEQMAALLFNQSDAGRGIGRQGRGPPPPAAPFAPHGFGHNPYYGHGGPQTQQVPTYSNLMKWFASWNACYSCGFDVAEGHTSQTCPQYLRKPDHDNYFT